MNAPVNPNRRQVLAGSGALSHVQPAPAATNA